MPEEINRVLTDELSSLLFCPTQGAVENLAAEGIANGVHLVGDVMADLVLAEWERAERESTIVDRLGLERGLGAIYTLTSVEPYWLTLALATGVTSLTVATIIWDGRRGAAAHR